MEPRKITHLSIDYSRTQPTNPRNGLKQLYSRVVLYTLRNSLADLYYLIIEQGDDLQTLINRLSRNIRQTQLPDLQPGLGRGYVEYPEIDRRISVQEYLEAMRWVNEYGLTNIDPKSLMIQKIYVKQASN